MDHSIPIFDGHPQFAAGALGGAGWTGSGLIGGSGPRCRRSVALMSCPKNWGERWHIEVKLSKMVIYQLNMVILPLQYWTWWFEKIVRFLMCDSSLTKMVIYKSKTGDINRQWWGVNQQTWGYQGLSTKRVAYFWRTLSAASTIWGKQHRTDWWGDVDIFMHFSFAMQKLARHYVLYLANYLPVYMNTGSSLTWLMDAILVPHVFHNWRNEYVYVGILNWRQDSSVKPSNFCQHKPNRILNTPLCLSMFGGSVCWVYVHDQIKA